MLSSDLDQVACRVERALWQMGCRLLQRGIREDRDFLAILTAAGLHSSFRGAWTLAQMGLGDSVYVIARRMFDIGLNYRFVMKDPDNRLWLFLNFAFVNADKQMRDLLRGLPPEKRPSEDKLRAIREQAASLKGQYEKGDWTKEDRCTRAAAVCWENLYATVYRRGSDFVHGSAATSEAYFDFSEESILFKGAVDPHVSIDGLIGACLIALDMLPAVSHTTQTPLLPDFNDVVTTMDQVIEGLKKQQ